MSYKIVIPARFASTRLPGKPLLPLAGKPILQHVYQQAIQSSADEVLIATDDKRIYQVAESFGAKVLLTDSRHENGTDRIAEVAQIQNWSDEQVVVNLQGDEPMMPVALIETVAQGLLQNSTAGISSLCTPIVEYADFIDPNVVKVVLDLQGFALYFSRAPIPFDRELKQQNKQQLSEKINSYRHIGMYAYRAGFLHQYQNMQVTQVEQAESLEQLRALYYGVRIHMGVVTDMPAHGVDTKEDLMRLETQFADYLNKE